MALNNRQERFCREYVIDCNATQAAIRAGYSKKTARQIGVQNLSKVNISERIKSMLEEIDGRKIATATEVMETLTRIMRGEEEGANVSDRIKAAELMGKRHQLFTDRLVVQEECPVIVYKREDGA